MAKTKSIALNKGPFQKQRANVYTVMLIASFLFLAVGALIMYKEVDRYRGPDGTIDFDAKQFQGRVTLVVPAPPMLSRRLTV